MKDDTLQNWALKKSDKAPICHMITLHISVYPHKKLYNMYVYQEIIPTIC